MNIRYFIVLIMMTCGLLCSCQQKSNQAVTGGSKDTAIDVGVESTSTPTHFKNVKPGAQVSLASEKLINLIANKTTPVEILLNANVGSGGLHVVLSADDGLQLVNGVQSFDFAHNETGQYKLSVDLSAVRDGRYYLNIMASINSADTTSSRALALIVQVGDVASNSEQSIKMLKESSPDEVKVLPAQEQVIH